jgi:very-short-patch-repair endonuclease
VSLLPRDFTKQENIISDCLSDLGLRYTEQYELYPYTVDFYIPELRMVVEADGTYGHLKKRDRKRDIKLQEYNDVEYILHIKENTRKAIKEFLCRELLNLTMIKDQTIPEQ